jgi:hypothetical protein
MQALRAQIVELYLKRERRVARGMYAVHTIYTVLTACQ